MQKILRTLLGKVKKSTGAGDTYYGETAQDYHARRIKVKKWGIEQETVNGFLSKVPDGSTVLDVPFGTGRFVEMYLKKGMTVYGIDISDDMLQAAKEVLGDSYARCITTTGDATASIPYEDDSFDLVVCWRFLKFFSYKKAAGILKEIHRVTRSKVILRMIVRNENTPPSERPERLKHIGGKIYEKDLLELIDRTGFRVLQKKLIYDGSKEEERDEPSSIKKKSANRIKVIYSYFLEKKD